MCSNSYSVWDWCLHCSCVTLEQISYWSASLTLLLQKVQQPPGTVLHVCALCPFLRPHIPSFHPHPPSLLFHLSLPPFIYSPYFISPCVLSLPALQIPPPPPTSFSLSLCIPPPSPLFTSIGSASVSRCPRWAFCRVGGMSGAHRVQGRRRNVPGVMHAWCRCRAIERLATHFAASWCSKISHMGVWPCSSLCFYRVRTLQGWSCSGGFTGRCELAAQKEMQRQRKDDTV